MRIIVLSILALAIYSVHLLAAPAPPESKLSEPTAEQLEAAKQAYAKLGAKYTASTNPQTKQTIHAFAMPGKTTDANLKDLPNLPFSFALDLSDTRVTDAGLKEIKEFKNLTRLWVQNTQVTDAGLKEIKDLKTLTVLSIENTTVTDAGVKEIKELKNLTNLFLFGTKVTGAGLKELQKALPRCQILR